MIKVSVGEVSIEGPKFVIKADLSTIGYVLAQVDAFEKSEVIDDIGRGWERGLADREKGESDEGREEDTPRENKNSKDVGVNGAVAALTRALLKALEDDLK